MLFVFEQTFSAAVVPGPSGCSRCAVQFPTVLLARTAPALEQWIFVTLDLNAAAPGQPKDFLLLRAGEEQQGHRVNPQMIGGAPHG